MNFRVVLRTKYDSPQSLGLFDHPQSVIDFLALWWRANNVQDSHWMQGFLSVSIENDDEEPWGEGEIGDWQNPHDEVEGLKAKRS